MNSLILGKTEAFSNFLLILCFFCLAIFSATSPHLIGVICFFLSLLSALLYIRKTILNRFNSIIIVYFILLLTLSFIFPFYSHKDSSAFSNVFKLTLLTTPILFLFSSNSFKSLVNSVCIRLYLPCLFFLLVIISYLQIHFNFSIKQYISGKELSMSYVELNKVIMACTVMFWFVAALITSKSTFDKLSKPISFFFFLVICLSAAISESSAAVLGLALSSLFLLISCFFTIQSKFLLKAFIVISIICVFFLPKQIYQQDPDSSIAQTLNQHIGLSSLHRIDIWERSISKIMEKPFTGWGNSDSKYLEPTNEAFKAELTNEVFKYDESINRPDFSYPHNIFLQITLELGFPGLIILILILNTIINGIYTLNPYVIPFAVACFVCALSIWMVGFPLWRSWWLVFISLLSGGFYILSNVSEQKNKT